MTGMPAPLFTARFLLALWREAATVYFLPLVGPVVLETLGGRQAVPSAAPAKIHDLSPSCLSKHLQKFSAHGLLSFAPAPRAAAN